MNFEKKPGLYPVVLVHIQHFDRIAIGGAMIDQVYDFELLDLDAEITRRFNGGWETRFDPKSEHPAALRNPSHIVAMYAEGQEIVWGEEGDRDSEVTRKAKCFSAVQFRWYENDGQDIAHRLVYLKCEAFGLHNVIAFDGVRDLKEAHSVALNPNHDWRTHWDEREDAVWDDPSYKHDKLRTIVKSLRSWQIVEEDQVPERVREYLRRTLTMTAHTVDAQFKVGRKFFELPKKQKKKD